MRTTAARLQEAVPARALLAVVPTPLEVEEPAAPARQEERTEPLSFEALLREVLHEHRDDPSVLPLRR